jgi:hypothetical protein
MIVYLFILVREKEISLIGECFIEVVSICKDYIIVEIPMHCKIQSNMPVKISFDNGQTFYSSSLTFDCLDTKDQDGIFKLVHYWITSTNEKVKTSSGGNMMNKYL